MSKHESIAPFADNWAYLKTELSWLDRVLMLAVARQRQDTKEVDRVARHAGDRATSHWWKGIITVNQKQGYDDCRHPPKTHQSKPQSYTQQLEARIQASQQQGILLALPWLKDRLQLTAFEKNVILLTLAPEVNRRFGRLYSYLQQQDDAVDYDLPTVDLCLRLLCRNDQEWRRARSQLAAPRSLLEQGILECIEEPGDGTLLSRHLRLADDITAYLLAESPDPAQLEHLTLEPTNHSGSLSPQSARSQPMPTGDEAINPELWLQPTPAEIPWQQLALPTSLLEKFQALSQAVAASPQGQIIGLAGAPGTGKQMVAIAIATANQLPLTVVDLATIPELESETALAAISTLEGGIVLLKSAHLWFGRHSLLEPSQLHSWLQQRRRQPGLTLLSVHHLQSLRPSWRHQWDGVFTLPLPNAEARRQILRQSMPAGVKGDRRLRWTQIARQLPLSGGELQTIVQTAIALMPTAAEPVLTWEQLEKAVSMRYPHLKLRAGNSQRSRAAKKKPG